MNLLWRLLKAIGFSYPHLLCPGLGFFMQGRHKVAWQYTAVSILLWVLALCLAWWIPRSLLAFLIPYSLMLGVFLLGFFLFIKSSIQNTKIVREFRWSNLLLAYGIGFFAFFFFSHFNVQNFIEVRKVVGIDMFPVLQPDDWILVDTRREILNRDQILWMRLKEKESVLRLRAIPGDSVFWSHDKVYVNDQTVKHINSRLLEEDVTEYCALKKCTLAPFSSLSVPDKHLFLVGDNYHDSFDSRFLGFFEFRLVKGVATHRLWRKSSLDLKRL